MPGYPRVDKGNDYLQGRFDGTVLDGLSWGYGALTGHDRLAAAVACTRPEVLQQLRDLEVSWRVNFAGHGIFVLCGSASILGMCPAPPPSWRQSSMSKSIAGFVFLKHQPTRKPA